MNWHGIEGRYKQNDSYDIYYCIRTYPGGPEVVAEERRQRLDHACGAAGYGFIDGKFDTTDGFEPTRVRRFVEATNVLGDLSPGQWQQDAFGQADAWLRALGLSPLARGNLDRLAYPYRHAGPIPARAGEPDPCRGHRSPAGAYPRSRGGTINDTRWLGPHLGLSPLARGNHPSTGCQLRSAGPIPARAGEPCRLIAAMRVSRAYPRSRGGTLE